MINVNIGAIFMQSNQKQDILTGFILLTATALALTLANLDATQAWYHKITHYGVDFSLANHAVDGKFFVNEVLMCVFFFNIGLELKYELKNGALSRFELAATPLIGAIGGMLLPAFFYLVCNLAPDGELRGWAIPTATDIAFAIGLLSLVEGRVAEGLKAFLLALAIYDDLGAIVIIGLFYSKKTNIYALLFSLFLVALMQKLNAFNHRKNSTYVGIGVLLWGGLLAAGIHTTLSGVITAVFIPMNRGHNNQRTLADDNNLYVLRKKIAPYVQFGILPLFAFFNAGTPISHHIGYLFENPVSLGIMLGLVFGKPLGIVTFCYLGRLFKLCDLPSRTSWRQLFGIGCLCGIGFTMSLFIGKLAFHKIHHQGTLERVKQSVLLGSLSSGILGLGLLSIPSKQRKETG